MEFDIDIVKGMLWPAAMAAFLLFIGMQLATLGLEPHASPVFVGFYQNLSSLALTSAIMITFFGIYRSLKLGEALALEWYHKLIIYVVFTVMIVVMTSSQGQMVHVPRASIGFQMSPETEIYTSSVIPAFTEDMLYLIAFPMLILTAILLTMEHIFSMEIGRAEAIGAIIMSCLIASTGFNIWLVPGFTSAHVPAYGEVQEAYLGAWVFSFGQSMVYMFTGWFAPIPHMIHNAMITSSELYQIQGGVL